MAKIPEGWKLSVRDNERHCLHGKTISLEKNLTPDEIDAVKQDIAARHNRLGLDKNLKKELYPELFD